MDEIEEKGEDCAWCGTGEGICAACTAALLAESAARQQARQGQQSDE